MKKLISSISFLLIVSFGHAQTIQDIINEVNIDSLDLGIKEFSGELSTVVDGNTVTIRNRQERNNDLASDYLVERFEKLGNISVYDQAFNSNGRNIIATQVGHTNPDDIYLICAHYDSMADYCADDNASGTIAILEIARILSTQCLDNTIVYALWDEEENGLQGSGYYANQARANNDNILGVLNIDMMGYDNNNDNTFDIDVRNIANSLEMKDDIISVLNTYSFNLNAEVVNPGTTSSDHARFWGKDYSALLIGESWETGDQTPYYHSSSDRASTLNMPYYYELTKLIMGYMVTKAGLVAIDNTVTQLNNVLTSSQSSVAYQWYNCDTNMAIPGAVNQSYLPESNGVYSVKLSSGSCSEFSECITYNVLDVNEFSPTEVSVYPNPFVSKINVEVGFSDVCTFKLYDVSGKQIEKRTTSEKQTTFDVRALSSGIYFLSVNTKDKAEMFKIIKE